MSTGNKTFANRFFEATILIAIASVIAYWTSNAYQTAYFQSFGINTDILTLSFTPEDFITPGLFIFVSGLFVFLTYLMIKGINYIFDMHHPKYLNDIIGLTIFCSFIATILSKGVRIYLKELFVTTDTHFILTIIFYSLGLISLILVAGRLGSCIYVMIKEKRNFFSAFKYSHVQNIKTLDQHNNSKYNKVTPLVFASIFAMLALFTGPQLMARKYAMQKTNFAELITSDMNSNINTLIIGKTNDGYITKQYNTISKKFLDEYRIITLNNPTLRPYKIEM